MITDHRTAPSHEPAAPSAWLVPVLTLATFLTMLHAVALGPLLPDIAEDLDTSVGLLGQIPALTMLLAALLGMLAGPLADRFGHSRALVYSLLTVVLSAAGMALAPSYLLLLFAALVGAVGRAMVQPVAMVIAGDRFTDEQQRRAISWVSVGVMGSVIAGVPLLTTVASVFGWRVALATLAGLTALLVPLMRHGVGLGESGERSNTAGMRLLDAYRPILRHHPTLGLIVASLLGNAGVWVMVTYLGAFHTERYGSTTQQVGWVYGVFGIMLFLGSLATGGRVGALPLRSLLITMRTITGVAVAAMFILPIPPIATLGLLGVQGLAIGVVHVAVVLLLLQESPAGRATTLTINTVALSLGIGLGSTLGGVLLSVAGFRMIGLCAFLLSSAAAVLIWSTRERSPRAVPVSMIQLRPAGHPMQSE